MAGIDQAAVSGAAPAEAVWQNWSGCVSAAPAAHLRPRDIDELRAGLATSQGPVRVAGTGHSFTPVAATSGMLVTLDALPGAMLDADREAGLARLQAGASLNQLSRSLQEHGLAFKNLGDIDVQTLAGATATATHGTGQGFPCLSAEIRELSLITATGDRVTASANENADLLKAARVALGSLGIIHEATVSVRAAFKLHRTTFVKSLKETLADAPAMWATHRNFEIFHVPFCDYALNVTHDETDADPMAGEANDDDASLRDLKRVRNLTGWSSILRRTLTNAVAKRVKPENMIDHSWQLLARERTVRFNEMEYHLPVETGLDALAEIIRMIERDRRDVFFPIECRMTAGDDSWLSPFQGAPRISIAIHAFYKDDYDWFFTRAEPIFRRHGGRPHWGKMHSLEAPDLRDLYPDFDRFLAVRKTLDPDGRLLNPHLARLWGEPFEA